MGLARLAILCSGFGSNLQAIISAIQCQKLTAEIVCVMSDQPLAYCLKRAQENNIPTVLLDARIYSTRSAMTQEILIRLQRYQVEWVILAGFMRLLGPSIIEAYRNRILNVHPSLLPAFPGKNAIQRAWEAKVSVTGVTVHFVDERIDTGPVILQEKVEVVQGESLESLEEKIHAVEHRLYPRAIQGVIYGLSGVM